MTSFTTQSQHKARYATIGLAIMTAVTLVACASSQPAEPDARVELRLMHTTDVHAYLLGYDYFSGQQTHEFGLEHTAAVIAQARAENPNHLLVDNGDLIQGSALGDWSAEQGIEYVQNHTHPVIAALNALQYDVGNLGNHEFDYGLAFLEAAIGGANFPYISANVFHTTEGMDEPAKHNASWDNPLVAPYVIKRQSFVAEDGSSHDINIGFIGFVPPQIMTWNRRHLAGKVSVRDMLEAARYYVPKMQAEGADVIVAVPHAGIEVFDDYPQFAEQASLALAQVEGIDAIQFGHQHRVFPGDSGYDDLPGVDNQGGYLHGVPAVQPGYWGSHLGIIDLTLDKVDGRWQVASSQVEARAVSDDYDPRIRDVVADAHDKTLAMLNTPVASLRQDISNYFAKVRPELTVQLINQAQLRHGQALQRLGAIDTELPLLSAAAPFRNGGRGPEDFTHFPAGTVTRGHLADLYMYPNTIQVVQVNGAQLRDWLEMSARVYHHISMRPQSPEPLLRDDVPSFNFDVIAGVTYEIQPQHPARFDAHGVLTGSNHHRIYNLRYNGELVSADDEFLVVTNNYRGGGGGNFPHLDGSNVVHDGAYEVRSVIADYMTHMGKRFPQGIPMQLNQHWYLALPRGARVEFTSGASEAALLEASRLREVEFVRETDDGFGVFKIHP